MSQLQGRRRRWLARRGAALALVAAAVAGPFSSVPCLHLPPGRHHDYYRGDHHDDHGPDDDHFDDVHHHDFDHDVVNYDDHPHHHDHHVRFPRAAQPALREAKGRCRAAGTDAGVRLRSLLWKVQRDSFLGADGTTLVTDLQADIAGLKSILSEIQAATDPQDLSTDLQDAYSTIRTYDFVVPVVGLVITIDQVDNVTVPALDAFVTTVQGELGSSNQGTLEPLLADLQAQVTSATTDTLRPVGAAAQLHRFDWNANHGLLWPAAKDVREANEAISAAQRDEAQINQYLSCYNNSGGNNGSGKGNGGPGGPGGPGHGHGRSGYWSHGKPGGQGNNAGCCTPTGYGKGGKGGRGQGNGNKGFPGTLGCGNGGNGGGGPGRGHGYPTTTTAGPTTTTSTSTTTTVPTTTTSTSTTTTTVPTTTTTSTTTTTTTVPTTTTTAQNI